MVSEGWGSGTIMIVFQLGTYLPISFLACLFFCVSTISSSAQCLFLFFPSDSFFFFFGLHPAMPRGHSWLCAQKLLLLGDHTGLRGSNPGHVQGKRPTSLLCCLSGPCPQIIFGSIWKTICSA